MMEITLMVTKIKATVKFRMMEITLMVTKIKANVKFRMMEITLMVTKIKATVKFRMILISITLNMKMTMLTKMYELSKSNVQLVCLLLAPTSGEIPYFKYTHCVN
jgi:hypothetical protein